MARLGPQHSLNPAFVRTCKMLGVYMDGGGLRFRVMPNGSRTWIMRITIRGVRRDISIGPLATVSLAKARERAQDIHKAVADGGDPATERQARRRPPEAPSEVTATRERPTFEACWQAYWTVKEPQLSNGKHREQWVSTMQRSNGSRVARSISL